MKILNTLHLINKVLVNSVKRLTQPRLFIGYSSFWALLFAANLNAQAPTCGAGTNLSAVYTGASAVTTSTGTITTPTSALGVQNGTVANITANSSLTLDMGSTLLAGKVVLLRYNSSATTAPMQLSVSTTSGGPYTNVLQVAPTTTMTTLQVVLPLNARYLQFATTAVQFNLDAVYTADYTCQPDNIPACSGSQLLTSYSKGILTTGATTGTVTNAGNMTDVFDGLEATIGINSSIIADYGSSLPVGTVLTVSYAGAVANPLNIQVSNSAGGPFIDVAILPGLGASIATSEEVTLPITARYIKFVTTASAYTVDAVTYKTYACVANPALTCGAGQTLVNYPVGTQSVAGQTGTPSNPLNAVGEIDGDFAILAASQSLTLDFGSVVAAGNTLSLRYNSNANVNPMQILVSTAAGGPFTNIIQIPANATVNTYSFVLPLAARYVRLVTNVGGGNYNVDALTSPQYVCVTPAAASCTDPAVAAQTETGATAVFASTNVTSGTNALGVFNGTDAVMAASAILTLDMGSVITAGNSIKVYYNSSNTTSPVQVWVSTTSGGTYTNIMQLPGSTTKIGSIILLPLDAKFIRFTTNLTPYDIDAVTKISEVCVTEPSPSCPTGQLLSSYVQGAQTLSGSAVGTVGTPANALQPINGTTANMSANSEFTVDMGSAMPAGTRLSVTYVSGTTTAPLQISVATTAGGPYTTVRQLPGSTTMTTNFFLLPVAAQFVRFNTTTVNYNIDAITFPVEACVPNQVPTCSSGQTRLQYAAGLSGSGASTGTVTTPTNLLDNVDATETTFNPSASLVVNYSSALPAGTVLTFNYRTNTTGTSSMFVWAATAAAGPYTNIAQLEPSTTSTTADVVLPATAQYFKLETNSGIFYYIDAVTYPVYSCVTPPASCASGQVTASYPIGLAAASQSVATVGTPANAIGTLNNAMATLSANAEMNANFATALPAGTVLSFTYSSGTLTAPLQVLVSSAAGGPFINIAQLPPITTVVTNTVTLPIGAQYLKMQTNATNFNIDAVTYMENVCVASPVPVCAANQLQAHYPTGVASVFTSTGVTTPNNITATPNGLNAVIGLSSTLTADMGSLLPAGTLVTLNYSSSAAAAYLQVEVAATSGGTYTNIDQIPGSTTATTSTFILPSGAQFIRLTAGVFATYTIDAMTYENYVCVANPVSACAVNEVPVSYISGLATVSSSTGVTNPNNITGVQDGNNAVLAANATLTADFGSILPAGTILTFRYSSGGGTAPLHVFTSSVAAAGPFTEVDQIPVNGTTSNYTLTLPFATQFIQLDADAVAFTIDAVTRLVNTCVTNPVTVCPSGQTQVSYAVGIASVLGGSVGVTNPLNFLGTMDGAEVTIAANGQITGDLGMNYPAGSVLTFNYNSNTLTAPLQVSVATASGGPYTNIAQVPASTTVTTAAVTVPITTRYIRLNTTGVVFNVDAVTRQEYACVAEPGPTCTSAQTAVTALNGISTVTTTTGSVTNQTNLNGIKDGLQISITANSSITGDFGATLPAGTAVTIYYTAGSLAAPLRFYIAPASIGPFTDIKQLPPSTTATSATIILTSDTRYIKLEAAAIGYTVDAITYTDKDCITPTPHTCAGGFRLSTYLAGASSVVTTTGTVTTPANATGTWNGTTAAINTTESITLDLGATANAGDPLRVYYSTNITTGQFEILGATASGGPYTHLGYALSSITATSTEFTLNTAVQYVQIIAMGPTVNLDAVTYTKYECVAYNGISGCVFYDVNNNGDNDAEMGMGGVIVKAYDASNALVATSVSSYGDASLLIPAGYYEFANLTPGAWYRVEYELQSNSGLLPSAEGSDNNTSVEFIQGGSTDHCFGIYQPSLFCSVLDNPRVVGATGTLGGASNAVFSWRYYDRSVDAVGGTLTPASHTRDVRYSQTGALWGLASQRGTNLIYAGAMSSDMPTVFPNSPDGPSALYILDYNSANGLQDYVGYKHLVNLSDLGINVATKNPTRAGSAYTFGEIGLGGLDISDDGNFLYVMNMGNGKLIKVDISGVDYNNLPATAPTSAVEINIPTALKQCGADVFRPTLVKSYNNKIYVGGICDGTSEGTSSMDAKLLTYDPATGTWSSVLSFPVNFTTGGVGHAGAPQVRWNDFVSPTVQNQPVFADLAFDSDGSMSLGLVNRYVMINAYSSTQTGYMLRTGIDANGNQQLEYNGVAGRYTTSNADAAQATADGPGTNWFYQQSSYSPNHIYTYNGGLFQKTGEPHVVAGVVDPHNAVSNGGTYYNIYTGVQEYNIQNEAGIAKVARITGGEQVCETVPDIEIGNRVWSDVNGNGIQDANELGIGNVTMELYIDIDENGVPDGTALATTQTASNGTWYFRSSNVLDGDPSTLGSQAGLRAGTGYIVRVGSSDWAAGIGTGDLLGFTMTLSDIGGAGQPNVRDNDAILPASNIPTIALKTGAPGENNHTYDIGFLQSCTMMVTSATPTVCAGNLYNVAVVVTYTNPPSGNITVNTSNGGTITVAQTTSPQTITLTGLTADGVQDIDVTAFFVATPTCTNTAMDIYDAPAACPCTMTVTSATPTACANNLYNLAVVVTYANPASGNITVNTSNGGTITVAQTSSPQTITLTGLTADGVQDIDVTAFFEATPTCTNTAMDIYDAPAACPCTMTVTSATPTACANNLYNLAVVVTYTNSPGGNITVTTTNGGTITVPATTSPQTITLTGLTANGMANIGVTAAFVATPACTNTLANAYNAPAACNCTMVVTSATPTACIPATNNYSLNVVVTYTNPPSGNITVNTSNGGTITVPQTSSPQTITLTGLTSNGTANIDVTAFFVATPTCTNTLASAYNAPAACNCVQPAANFVPIPAKCINLVPQDNGRIVLTAFTNADRFGVNLGNTYAGPAYAAATTITGINQDLQTGIPNVGGGTYTVRIFNGSNTCFKDYVITVPPGFPCKSDPMGFIYCEESGKIIAGGTITVTPPAGATYVITQNGSTGVYQFFTDAFVPGIYTMTYTPPAGYMASTTRLPGSTLDPTGQPDPYILGSGSASGTVLDNFTAAANPFYMVFNFESGDPEVLNNNIPLKGCCVTPVLTVQNGAVCAGDVINLTTRVTGNTPTGVLTFHLTQADALAGTNALLNTVVAPAVTTTYYVRSTATGPDGTCSDVESVQITVVNPPTALATTNGAVCPGSSIDLSTLVANNGGGNLSFYSTQANAQAGTSPLGSSTVSPASATNYYVRSTFTSSNTTCASAKEVIVSIKPLVCGAITISGPN
jgi:SdrD B-like domain